MTHRSDAAGTAPVGSALQLYLRDITRTPLLTAAEEVTLAQRRSQGDPSAVGALVLANLRLVVGRAPVSGPRSAARGSDCRGQLWPVGGRPPL